MGSCKICKALKISGGPEADFASRTIRGMFLSPYFGSNCLVFGELGRIGRVDLTDWHADCMCTNITDEGFQLFSGNLMQDAVLFGESLSGGSNHVDYY